MALYFQIPFHNLNVTNANVLFQIIKVRYFKYVFDTGLVFS